MVSLARFANQYSGVAPKREYAPVPQGKYTVSIRNTEVRENSKKTGHFIKFEFEIVDGEHKGRRFWEHYNVDNPNPITEERASESMSTIHALCGLPGSWSDTDSDDYIGHVIPAFVTTDKNDRDPTKLENKINFRVSADSNVGASRPAAPAAAGAIAGASKAPAWAQKRAVA